MSVSTSSASTSATSLDASSRRESATLLLSWAVAVVPVLPLPWRGVVVLCVEGVVIVESPLEVSGALSPHQEHLACQRRRAAGLHEKRDISRLARARARSGPERLRHMGRTRSGTRAQVAFLYGRGQ